MYSAKCYSKTVYTAISVLCRGLYDLVIYHYKECCCNFIRDFPKNRKRNGGCFLTDSDVGCIMQESVSELPLGENNMWVLIYNND